MKHPDFAIWSDYIRGLLDPDSAAGMQLHLTQGCGRCQRQVSALEALRRVAETDLELEPPSGGVTAVKSLIRLRGLADSSKAPRLRLGLVFDSFREPWPLGARDAGAGDRHLVYESAALTVDLALRAGLRTPEIEVRGRLFDADSNPAPEVPVFLIADNRISSHTLSGSLGEFDLLADNEDSARLCLVAPLERLIDIELPGLAECAPPEAH